jgi:hypothetical protein
MQRVTSHTRQFAQIRDDVSSRSRYIELMLNCARIGFNP